MKNILICPLDWGMGHATRVRQIAYRLQQDGHNVIIAASEPLLKVYDDSVCSGKIVFSSLRVRYSSFLPQYLVILLQAPFLLIQFLSDHYRVGRLVKRHNIDIVISDNRFGAWTKRVRSVYITHQLTIKLPGKTELFARLLTNIHRWIASMYDECWIPDIENGMAGELTDYGIRFKARHIGILSMLNTCEEVKPEGLPAEGYYAVIISGPEPQRSLLEEKLLDKLSGSSERFVFAAGRSAGVGCEVRGTRGIWYYNYLDAGEMKYVLNHSKGVICRGGYSTLMDLVVVGKGAIVIPTPGQTEQEYLAEYLGKKGWLKSYSQSEIEEIDIKQIPHPPGFEDIRERSKVLLGEALDKLIRRPSSQSKQ